MSERIISIGVTENEFQEIQSYAQEQNMSVSMYCKSILIPTTKFCQYYKRLLKKIKELPSSSLKFTIRDLWKTEDWDTIPKGIKLAMGRQFYSEVDKRLIKNINIEGYGSAKTMQYSKHVQY
jgi:hypothetical protein